MSETGVTTRERLLQAARELFTTIGYQAATTPVIARHAGVAEGTIYRHFPSKQALFNQAYQEAQQWGMALLRSLSQGPEMPANQRLASLARGWLEQGEQEPAMIRLLLIRDPGGVFDERSRMAASELRQGVERMIALGKQEGVIRAGVVGLWASIWITLIGFAADRVASREWSARHPHALATIDAAWDAIASRSTPTGLTSRVEEIPPSKD